MPNKSIPTVFDVEIFGDVEQLNETVSKARCRVFYKYANRNGGYITDSFAENLLSTIPYAPIKGIYDPDEGDFTGHGMARTEGRIYGVVMAEPNFAWETHTDADGIAREYACVDVLLFTALYPVAKNIVGKSLSMELYENSIVGEWKVINDNYFFVYEKACFLGLQVLGDNVEPCFEGASFFSLVNSIQELVNEMKEFTKVQRGEGGITMDNKENMELEAEVIDEATEEVTEFDVAEEEVSEEIKEEVEEENKEEESEEEAEEEASEDDKEEEVAEEEPENDEVAEENTTSDTETVSEELEQANLKIAELENEIAELREFKLAVEKTEKEAVIASYEELLSDEVLESYKARIDEFSSVDLDKDLAYELKKSGMFTKGAEAPEIVPSREPELSGIESILEKYKK